MEVGDFFAADFDTWMSGDEVGDAAAEFSAVDGEGVAGGDGGFVGGGEEEGACAAHFLLEEPGGGVFGFALEGVGADEFGEVGGLVGLGGAEGAHFGEDDFAAEAGGLQGGFGAGEAAADDVDSFHCFRIGDGVGTLPKGSIHGDENGVTSTYNVLDFTQTELFVSPLNSRF